LTSRAVNERPQDGATLASDGRTALHELLGPTSLKEFFDRYWEHLHLFVPASPDRAIADLLSFTDFEAFLSRNDVRYPAIQVVKNGQNVALSDYARQLKIGTYASDGLISMDSVAEAYRNKGTVVVQLMQNSFTNLAEFSRALGSFLHARVDVHGFLTPPSAQGLSAHYDAASAFLIQLRGAKRWRLYAMRVEAPGPDQTFDATEPITGNPIDEIQLSPGDVLYLPRGLPHEGLTLDTYSLHLTVVPFPQSWIEILSSVLLECQKEEDFRKAPVEPLVGTFSCAAWADKWSTLLQRFTTQARCSAASPIVGAPHVISPRSRRGRWT
jgi:ribosomal protein L16 Arg81 hydroxylase